MKKEFTNKRINCVDIAMAFSICLPGINSVLGFSGASAVTLSGLVIMLVFCFIKRKLSANLSMLIIPSCIIVCFLISIIIGNDVSIIMEYFTKFLGLGIVALIISQQDFNEYNVIKCITMMGPVVILVILFRNLAGDVNYINKGMMMGAIYSIMPVTLAAIQGIAFKGIPRFCSIADLFLSAIVIVKFGQRGAIVVVAVYIWIVIYAWYTKSKNRAAVKKIKAAIFLVLSLVIVLIIVFYFEQILMSVNDIIESCTGVRVYAIDKYFRKLDAGDTSGGRMDLWKSSLELIKDKMMLGSGIGYFESLSGGSYCHNVFLQAACEFGFIFVIPVLILFFGAVRKILCKQISSERDKYDYYLFSILFCNGMVVLLYSSVYWINIQFWLFVGYYLRKKKR